MDRNNIIYLSFLHWAVVALRKESVDRNTHRAIDIQTPTTVALRKESVDRNFGPSALSGPRAQSLSARRAWIEIKINLY